MADDGLALLVERVAGVDDLNAAGDAAARSRVLGGFFAALAELHNLPVDALHLPNHVRPVTPEDHALADLRLWRGIFDGFVTAPAPALRLAFRWLAEHPPPDPERTVLCHGDAGPGNFLFDGDRVTALLDWEFARPGRPHG